MRTIRHNNGQAMLLTAFVLAASAATALTIAGFLTINQMKQAELAEDSAQALFAADTGVEYSLFRVFKEEDGACDYPAPVFDNESITFELTEEITEAGELLITSVGEGNDVTRAFRVNLGEFSDVPPCSE